jgi:anti-sigma regulatory factor (Ser/Thr protein kinase)
MRADHLKTIIFQPLSSEEKFEDLDLLFQCASNVKVINNIVIDMRGTQFLVPSRAVSLVLACRYISLKTGIRVLIKNVSQKIQKYMLRMDIPSRAQDWLEIDNLGDDKWSRNPHTPQLLELTRIASSSDVERIVERAGIIFSKWLGATSLNSFLSALSELCSNVYQHSQDSNGVVTIQKYERLSQNIVNIQVAIGDLGQGIRGSLETRYGILSNTATEYIKLAMEGKSARETGRGGLGLRRVEQILSENQGYLFLRSHDASVYSHHKVGRSFTSEKHFFPGTQIALGLYFLVHQNP